MQLTPYWTNYSRDVIYYDMVGMTRALDFPTSGLNPVAAHKRAETQFFAGSQSAAWWTEGTVADWGSACRCFDRRQNRPCSLMWEVFDQSCHSGRFREYGQRKKSLIHIPFPQWPGCVAPHPTAQLHVLLAAPSAGSDREGDQSPAQPLLGFGLPRGCEPVHKPQKDCQEEEEEEER